MNKRSKLMLFSLFLAMLFLGIFTIHSIIKIQSYGQLINYVGIVRGATQRLVKLELEGQASDDIILYLDDILDNLVTGSGKYGLVRPNDKEYLQNLDMLYQSWCLIKQEIMQVRSSPDSSDTLLENSEAYFVQANTTVFSAQKYSQKQSMLLMIMIIASLCCTSILWFLIIRNNLRKISYLKTDNMDLSDRAGRDSLTGAYTFDYFKMKAQMILDHRPEENYAVFYMDFDNFKYINDVFGYTCGDDILRAYADIIQQDLQKGETFGRVNADNFVALKKYDNKEDILTRQLNLDQQTADFMHTSHAKYILQICCGICCLEDLNEQLKIEGLLDRANFARKTVKQGLHKNYAFYNDNIRRQLMNENDIRSGLENAFLNHEFLVYYQPKISLPSEYIAGAEALVRWKKQDGTLVPPDTFIPVLEKDQNIALLDQYVFRVVCRWLQQQLLDGISPLPVSVNVSRLQFYDPDFVAVYTKIKEQHGLPSGLIEIEFTESIAFDNINLLIEIVHNLKHAGFPCCIDDFGKGYSSLSILKALPVDVLKIDSQFFIDMDEKEKDRLIVKGIIDITRQLHIKTVAEGIETPEQVEFLKQAHCDYIQGYVYYRPMPVNEYEALLERTVFSPEKNRNGDI